MNSWNAAVEVLKNCLKAGIGEFVVCAGARNAALLEALARAEIGISTDKLHARGPMGLRELTSYQYRVRGDGQIRT